jgi:hypothetical protein
VQDMQHIQEAIIQSLSEILSPLEDIGVWVILRYMSLFMNQSKIILGINIRNVEMGSGAMIYVPSFIKIGSGVQKV